MGIVKKEKGVKTRIGGSKEKKKYSHSEKGSKRTPKRKKRSRQKRRRPGLTSTRKKRKRGDAKKLWVEDGGRIRTNKTPVGGPSQSEREKKSRGMSLSSQRGNARRQGGKKARKGESEGWVREKEVGRKKKNSRISQERTRNGQQTRGDR